MMEILCKQCNNNTCLVQRLSLNTKTRSGIFLVCICALIGAILDQLALAPAAYAHFYGGTTVSVDGYQVTFVPYPSKPVAGDRSTRLNFSVLMNNSDIYNVYAALTIAKKGQGGLAVSTPYKLFVFSDMTIPMVINETGDYNVTLFTLITGSKYGSHPLTASFDLVVVSPVQALFSDRVILVIGIVIPTAAGAAVIFVYLWKKK